MTLQERLKQLRACAEAVVWVGSRTLSEAWDACERADWMLWLCGRMVGKPGWPTHQQVVLAACACAETVLHLVPAGEDRPRKASQTARAWCAGTATLEEVRTAADDAAIAADAAAAYAAAYAAYAAAYAAYAAAYAAYAAADAAAYAACAATDAAIAADAAARHKQQLLMCAKIREMLTIPESL